MQLVNGNQNWNASVRGVSPEYIALKNWPVVQGDMFTDATSERAAPVCVLGQTVVAISCSAIRIPSARPFACRVCRAP